MKKVLITDEMKAILDKERSFLGRENVVLLSAQTNEDLLRAHMREKVNLIIALLDTPGMKSEDLYARIRENQDLRAVSVILLCHDTPADLERGAKCGANVVMTLPVNASLLLEKAHQLLDISWRGSYRVLLSVNIEGSAKETPFFCSSENLSTTGILLVTDRVLTVGNRVACSFFLPDSKRIKASGEVVRVIGPSAGSKHNKYGIKFSELTAEARSSIEAFVEKKSQISIAKK